MVETVNDSFGHRVAVGDHFFLTGIFFVAVGVTGFTLLGADV